MTAIELLLKIKDGINADYSYNEIFLEEPKEKMKVDLSDIDINSVIIQPKDVEKNNLWNCFSDNTDLYIADYIIFKVVGDEVVAFILELKNNSNGNKAAKAAKQIISTHPLVKMIYEKTTGENPENIRTVGLKVFGPSPKKDVIKIPRNSKRILPETIVKEKLAIASFTQNTKKEKLTSLSNLYKEMKKKVLKH